MSGIFTKDHIAKLFLGVHKRLLVDKPVAGFHLAGCCHPAARRLYIAATGKYYLCEKIGDSPCIGDVDTGIDLGGLKRHYLDDYMEHAKKICGSCWAVRICGNCYVDCYDKDGFRPDYMEGKCASCLQLAEFSLRAYHEILEKCPEKLSFLGDIQVS